MTEVATRRRSLEERGHTRLTFDVPTAEAEKLDQLAARLGYNKVTTALRALRVFKTLVDADRIGATVTITHADGTKERLLIT